MASLCTRAAGRDSPILQTTAENAGRHQGRRVRDVGRISGNDIATLQVLKGYYKLLRRMISLPRTAKRDEAEHEEQHIL